ncbi:MAG: hypothetical protein ABSF17_08265 [Terracidiphilus sp.]
MSDSNGEGNTTPETHHQAIESGVLTVSVHDFSALEERILRAVEVVRRERQTRAAAEERATKAEGQLHEQASHIDHLEKELGALRTEREQVRGRVDRLLGQLDALEL